jgi:hypothetical protein
MGRQEQMVAVLLIAGFLGCNSASDVSSPEPADLSRATISAVSPTMIFGLVGSDAKDLPTVRITNKADGQPVSGATVVFTITGSKSATLSVTTGGDGIARLGSLKLDGTAGQYNVFATAAGLSSVRFTTLALTHAPIAVYDLESEGGMAIPVSYPEGNGQSNTITGGNYVLLDDGSYIYGVENKSEPRLFSAQRFLQSGPQTIDFYSVDASAPPPAGFPDPGYLFSIGTISGNTLSVTYYSPDFIDDVYVLRQ